MNKKLADAIDKALKQRVISKMTSDTRDVMIVLLGAALLRMDSDKLTVGQTVDLLIKMLAREGYEIAKKEGTT